jgi:pteridine reductase
MQESQLNDKVVLVTGGARRIGAEIVRQLHRAGMRVVIHYRSSDSDARALSEECNRARPQSATVVQGDLQDIAKLDSLVRQVLESFGRMDVVVNNASCFYATPVGRTTEEQWKQLVGINLKVPFFLVQSAAGELRRTRGCVINIADIYGRRPLREHPVYCAAKAGLIMLTQALGADLGPEVRVNGIAPGAILWPENAQDEALQRKLVARTPLKRTGRPEEIAAAVLFLIRDGSFTTGEILTVDGGRALSP